MRKVNILFQVSLRLISLFFLVIILGNSITAQIVLPRPDHIVIAFLENHAYSQIIDSAYAPYINSLATDENAALFNRSYGIEHPSQPNYLDFFSGSNQGVTDNNVPLSNPFKTPNLGRQLTDSMLTFVTYSEDLPYEGFNGATFNQYVRKHNPVTNWIGSDTNQISQYSNQPFTAFPLSDFDALPTVSFVMPNQSNNMHDGEDPSRIERADTWLFDHLGNYIEWTKTHNSLFILTFDEDNYEHGNRIVTIFMGMMVKGGVYNDSINHYSVLRTIEDMYGLPYAGNASSAVPVTRCWKEADEINETGYTGGEVILYPNPVRDAFSIQFEKGKPGIKASLEICNSTGNVLLIENVKSSVVNTVYLGNILPGIYLVRLVFDNKTISKKLIIP